MNNPMNNSPNHLPTNETEAVDPASTDDLFQRYISGEITEEEGQTFWNRLQNSPELGESLFEQMELDVMLEEAVGEKRPLHFADYSVDESSKSENVLPVLRKRRSVFGLRQRAHWLTLSAAALVAVIGLIVIGLRLPLTIPHEKDSANGLADNSAKPELPAVPEPVQPEPTSAAVAIISGTADAVWDNRSGAFRQGQSVEAGWLRLRSGLISLTFFNGAEVVMEGPAELEIISINHVLCRFGNINVTVPEQAHGFLVSSPQMIVKDLGTAFSVSVTPRGTEVHVIKGEIELHDAPFRQDNLPENLKEGEALFVAAQGDLRRFQANNDVFAPTRSLKGKTKDYLNLQYEKWKSRRQRFDSDPFLLFHFDFENQSSGAEAVSNAVPSPKSNIFDGRIVGCRLTEGRWSRKGAVEFSRTSDRIRVRVPESCESMTISAWIRVSSLDRRSNALFITENETIDGQLQPALQWTISQSGNLRLEMASPIPGEQFCYESPPYFQPEHFGQWTHLAVVVNGLEQTVSHFVDGVLIGKPLVEVPFKEALPIHIGMAEIGNAPAGGNPKKGKPIRNFCGCMDEFHFFTRALSREEIWDLYDPVFDWNDKED